MINPSGILCAECDQPVRWVRPEHSTHVGHWVHDTVDAAMERHPAGGAR